MAGDAREKNTPDHVGGSRRTAQSWLALGRSAHPGRNSDIDACNRDGYALKEKRARLASAFFEHCSRGALPAKPKLYAKPGRRVCNKSASTERGGYHYVSVLAVLPFSPLQCASNLAYCSGVRTAFASCMYFASLASEQPAL